MLLRYSNSEGHSDGLNSLDWLHKLDVYLLQGPILSFALAAAFRQLYAAWLSADLWADIFCLDLKVSLLYTMHGNNSEFFCRQFEVALFPI